MKNKVLRAGHDPPDRAANTTRQRWLGARQSTPTPLVCIQSLDTVVTLLGAVGVAWLGEVRDGGSARLVLRLSAVDSGLVVGWRSYEVEQPDAAGWAGRAAAELETWRPKLAVTRDAARAVSLLNLHGGGGTGAPNGVQTLDTGDRRWRRLASAWPPLAGRVCCSVRGIVSGSQSLYYQLDAPKISIV